MTESLEIELRAAGYTDAQIAKEVEYLARLDLERVFIREDAAWGFGFHHADWRAA